jgi:RNA polymerase sigma-70 factor (ECF subfamily)
VNNETDFQHPGIIAEQKERATILFKALQALPGNQMTAFVLQKMEGLSLVEIANILDISSKAVESLLSRAKVNLQQFILKNYESL